MRFTLGFALLLAAITVQAIPPQQKSPARTIPCKTADNASICYWTRGRITCCNGNPSMRMWKVGTKRILGIMSGPDSQRRDIEDSLHPELPASLNRAYDTNYKRRVKAGDPDAKYPDPVFGDFEICPLDPERPGWMQDVCIESANGLFFQHYAPRH